MVLEIIFICLAAISKAVADTLVHHFDSSIFYHPNSRFWNLDVSNKFPRYIPFTKYKVDAWHLFSSAMIVFFIAAACVHKSIAGFWWDLLILGVIFNVCFNVFYNKIFR